MSNKPIPAGAFPCPPPMGGINGIFIGIFGYC